MILHPASRLTCTSSTAGCVVVFRAINGDSKITTHLKEMECIAMISRLAPN